MEHCKQLLIFSILITFVGMTLCSEWSACSRTCGVGIMQRYIPSQNASRDGTKREFKVCNVKKCSGGDDDFRSEQCRMFGGKMISFVNESNPCKLMCSSPGQHPVKKGLVVDGTPCLSGGVCVDGDCVCSDECEKGSNVICTDGSGKPISKLDCSMLTEHKDKSACTGDGCHYEYMWVESNWTSCSVRCGKGFQTRNVRCANYGRIVDYNICLENIHYQLEKNRACQGPHCEGAWIASDWFECVAVCNERGKQYRNIHCVYEGKTSSEYHYIKCDPATKPPYVQDCYKSEGCLPEWKGQWSQCSATCDGTQRRRIECKLGNETLPAERCPIGKPSIFQRCSPECPVLEVCKKEYCHLDSIESCPKECCDECKVSLAQFKLTPLQRYNLCEKECCKKCVKQQ
ncbi:A disintegrin and metalloproteinase with thrombospondin motifs 17-like [Dysidea avara]|uniref:A disintegrin and metalloproteinase with thrombospondin motifs 17-like n=1 Tax=Dysidea avara TaxID=196820 RepID=UPI003320202D